jgi:hypothetical protein
LIAPAYVKPFVKRQKNDMADSEAITETAGRPTMRFVAVKSAEKQAWHGVQDPRPSGSVKDAYDQRLARSPYGARHYCTARGFHIGRLRLGCVFATLVCNSHNRWHLPLTLPSPPAKRGERAIRGEGY